MYNKKKFLLNLTLNLFPLKAASRVLIRATRFNLNLFWNITLHSLFKWFQKLHLRYLNFFKSQDWFIYGYCPFLLYPHTFLYQIWLLPSPSPVTCKRTQEYFLMILILLHFTHSSWLLHFIKEYWPFPSLWCKFSNFGTFSLDLFAFWDTRIFII